MGQTWNPSFWTPSFSRNSARRLRNDPGFRSTSPFSPGHTQNDHPAGDRLNSSCIAKKRHVCWSKQDKIIQNLGSFCLPFIPLLWWDIQDRKTGALVMDNPIPMTSGCAAVSRRHWRSEHCWSEMLRRYQVRETSEVDMSFCDGKKGKRGKKGKKGKRGKRGKRADFVKTPVLFFLLMDVHGVVLVCGLNLVW